LLAKAGLKVPQELRDDQVSENDYVVRLFVNRTPRSREESKQLRGLLDIYRKGGDLVTLPVSRRVSMEFDFKRKPVNPSTRPINGVDHLYFDTVPWKSNEEFNKLREAVRVYRTDDAGVLKTVDDLKDFEEFCAIPRTKLRVRSPRKDPAITLAKRMLLRAYVRSLWGLDRSAMSYSELAAWLTALGVATSKEDVENANRPNARVQEIIVPATPAVTNLVVKVRERFPAFDASKLLKPD
jgi:hypothetical protein